MPYFKKLKTESESKGRRGIILKFKKKGKKGKGNLKKNY